MAKLLEISKNKGPCDPRLHCSTKLENFSFSLRSFFLLVHKVSSSIFPYMDLKALFWVLGACLDSGWPGTLHIVILATPRITVLCDNKDLV